MSDKLSLELWDITRLAVLCEDKLQALKTRESQLDTDTSAGLYEYSLNINEQYELGQLIQKLTKPSCECNCGRCH